MWHAEVCVTQLVQYRSQSDRLVEGALHQVIAKRVSTNTMEYKPPPITDYNDLPHDERMDSDPLYVTWTREHQRYSQLERYANKDMLEKRIRQITCGSPLIALYMVWLDPDERRRVLRDFGLGTLYFSWDHICASGNKDWTRHKNGIRAEIQALEAKGIEGVLTHMQSTYPMQSVGS